MQFEDSQPRSGKIRSKNEDPPKRNRLIRIKKMLCKWAEIRDTYLRRGEKQAREVLGDQEQNHNNRL